MELNDSVGVPTSSTPTTSQRQPLAFVVACSKFFGRLPNQPLTEFNKELQALTPADREELKEMLKLAGYSVI